MQTLFFEWAQSPARVPPQRIRHKQCPLSEVQKGYKGVTKGRGKKLNACMSDPEFDLFL